MISISILYGASTLDHLLFEVFELRQPKLSVKGSFAQGLCVFGDNSYANTFYIVTPYFNPYLSGDKIGDKEKRQKDAYIFYHSQLRVMIKGALGWLIQV